MWNAFKRLASLFPTDGLSKTCWRSSQRYSAEKSARRMPFLSGKSPSPACCHVKGANWAFWNVDTKLDSSAWVRHNVCAKLMCHRRLTEQLLEIFPRIIQNVRASSTFHVWCAGSPDTVWSDFNQSSMGTIHLPCCCRHLFLCWQHSGSTGLSGQSPKTLSDPYVKPNQLRVGHKITMQWGATALVLSYEAVSIWRISDGIVGILGM